MGISDWLEIALTVGVEADRLRETPDTLLEGLLRRGILGLAAGMSWERECGGLTVLWRSGKETSGAISVGDCTNAPVAMFISTAMKSSEVDLAEGFLERKWNSDRVFAQPCKEI